MIVALAGTTPVSAQANETATPKEYTVVEGDYLDKIATANGTTWKRIFNKNLQIENADRILVGDKVVIPTPTEVVPERVAPVQAPTQAPVTPVGAPQAVSAPKSYAAPIVLPEVFTAPVQSYGGPNTYTAGQCTWHVKNLKPSLPNNLGNASDWYYTAKAQGLAVGTTPQAGAAAPRKYGNHVVYVQAVNGDGTITVSEMNYNWTPYQSRTTVKPASDYYYIY